MRKQPRVITAGIHDNVESLFSKPFAHLYYLAILLGWIWTTDL